MNEDFKRSIYLLSHLDASVLEGVSKELDKMISLREEDKRRDECLALLCSFLAKVIAGKHS